MDTTTRVGLIGTGLLGQAVARRLAAVGCRVEAWNRTKGKALGLEAFGVKCVDSVEKLLSGNNVIICLLSDADACDEVIFTETRLSLIAHHSIIIMMSTLTPEKVVEQQLQARRAKLDYVDMPVSGGTKGAEKGTLSLMAGGAKQSIDRLRPLLTHLGKVTRVGEVGAGQLTKLANQIIVAGTLCLLSEAFTLAQRGGADPIKVREALLGGFADSTLLQQHGERMVESDFCARGSAAWQLKDTKSIMALAEQLDLTLPLTDKVNVLFSQMVAAGDGDLDHCGIIRQIQRLNGLSI